MTSRDRLKRLAAAGVITVAELEILDFRRRGFSQFEIANGLLISRSSVRDREKNAQRKIALLTDRQLSEILHPKEPAA